MSNDKHTPTPWMVSGRYRYQVCNDFKMVANCETQIDAARIVQCVNEYDELIETIATLRSEKAELIEALRFVQEFSGKWMSACISDDLSCDQIKYDFSMTIEKLHRTLAKIETK
jgi:hypothetical protein